MDRVKVPNLSSARDFFATELKSVMAKNQVTAQPGAVDYLVNLLLGYLESEKFFVKNGDGKLEDNVLADLYAEYIHGGPETKKIVLRRLGDICLLVTGFFADSLKRKLVDLDYYLGMGGSAYWQLSHFHSGGKPIFEELALKFRPFSDILGELSERSGLQTNSDLLRLYERWLFTGSERLRRLLSENGISTVTKSDPQMKH